MYTIGALKCAKRRGTAYTYRQALDQLEAEQVGDRGCRLTRTLSADDTAAIVNRINRINEGERVTINGIKYVHDYDRVYADGTRKPHYSSITRDKPIGTSRKIGKVLGALYTEWDNRSTDLDPVEVIADKDRQEQYRQVQSNLSRFFREYVSRLSDTSKARLQELAKSTDKASYLTSLAGYKDKATKRLAAAIRYLYDNFVHKDAISCSEFIELVRKYVHVTD
jgi:uncharacterized protein YeaO (DUF488 family)